MFAGGKLILVDNPKFKIVGKKLWNSKIPYFYPLKLTKFVIKKTNCGD